MCLNDVNSFAKVTLVVGTKLPVMAPIMFSSVPFHTYLCEFNPSKISSSTVEH